MESKQSQTHKNRKWDGSCQGLGCGKNEKLISKRTKVELFGISSGDLMYSVETIVNTVLYI